MGAPRAKAIEFNRSEEDGGLELPFDLRSRTVNAPPGSVSVLLLEMPSTRCSEQEKKPTGDGLSIFLHGQDVAADIPTTIAFVAPFDFWVNGGLALNTKTVGPGSSTALPFSLTYYDIVSGLQTQSSSIDLTTPGSCNAVEFYSGMFIKQGSQVLIQVGPGTYVAGATYDWTLNLRPGY